MEKKRVTIKGKRVTIKTEPMEPEQIDKLHGNYSYVPEQERVYVRGRQWLVEKV